MDVYGSTGIQDVLDKAVFNLLHYIAVYPVTNNKLEDKDGNKLPDCFLIPNGTWDKFISKENIRSASV